MSLTTVQNPDAESAEIANADTVFDFTSTPDEPTSPALETALQAFAAAVEGPPDADVLLATVRGFITRYCILSNAQATICAAWVLHTWTIKAFNKTPYLLIEAAERNCGKSNLIKTLMAISFEALPAGAFSAAALIREVDAKPVTVFMDEIDQTFKFESEGAGILARALNFGFERGWPIGQCDGPQNRVKKFKTFSAKALSGISGSRLPDATISRCIQIEMRRKLDSETVADIDDTEDLNVRADSIKAKLKAWATQETIDRLRELVRSTPKEYTNRQGDLPRPLFAIADLAGEPWPDEIRNSLTEVFAAAAQNREPTPGEKLLADIRAIFESKHADKLSTQDLLTTLCEQEESPWATWNRGKALSPRQLATYLKRFDIAPRTARFSDGRAKAYHAADFLEAWTRYLQSDSQAA